MKKSGVDKVRLDLQIYLAKHAPSDEINLSTCGLSCVPDGVYALCKVLLKKVLILHSNRLTSLKEGQSYIELEKAAAVITVLDLHNNHLTELPPRLELFGNLQILDLKNNRLSELPSSIEHLRNLQRLNLCQNQLCCLPSAVGKLIKLTVLDISCNSIQQLPDEMFRNCSLVSLELDFESMVYPDAETCRKGASAIIEFLCRKNGIAFVPSSDASAPSEQFVGDSSTTSQFLFDPAVQKQKQQLLLQKELLASQEQQAGLVAHLKAQKRELLRHLSEEEETFKDQLFNIQEKKDAEKRRLLVLHQQMEQESLQLICKLQALNERARKAELIGEAEERSRLLSLQRTVDEYSHQRCLETKKAMEEIMLQTYNMEALRRLYESGRAKVTADVLQTELDQQDGIQLTMEFKERQMRGLVQQLLRDQGYQKEAVELLLVQKDAKTQRINSELRILETELISLTVLELRKKDLKLELEMQQIESNRLELTKLFEQLLLERKKRSAELKEILLEIEKERRQNEENFWLVQYERLLRFKPQSVADAESLMESEAVKLLYRCNLEAYLPLFAAQKLTTLRALSALNDSDLEKIGLRELGSRRLLLAEIQAAVGSSNASAKAVEKVAVGEKHPHPSAPPIADEAQSGVARAHFEQECVICLHRQCCILFTPCGHVCACTVCCSSVQTCPLCRRLIESRINIDHE